MVSISPPHSTRRQPRSGLDFLVKIGSSLGVPSHPVAEISAARAARAEIAKNHVPAAQTLIEPQGGRADGAQDVDEPPRCRETTNGDNGSLRTRSTRGIRWQ